jgi:hypothetical protein
MTKRRDDDKETTTKRGANEQTYKYKYKCITQRSTTRVNKMWRAESIINGIRPFELLQNGLTDFQIYRITDSTCNVKNVARQKSLHV